MQFKACLHVPSGGWPQIGEVTCGEHIPPILKRDQIKMRDYLDRRAYPTKAGYLTYLESPTSIKTEPLLINGLLLYGDRKQRKEVRKKLPRHAKKTQESNFWF